MLSHFITFPVRADSSGRASHSVLVISPYLAYMRGGGDWLPILGALIILAFLARCVEWAARYFINRRRKKLMRLERHLTDDSFNDICPN